MYRQAYLIIAHRYDETFKTLLQMLDSDENDIFVHMDKKNKQFDEKECRGLVKRSGLFFAERTSVTWRGYSQINSEMILLEMAVSHKSMITTICFLDKIFLLKQTIIYKISL